jgi:hypothetical protein
VSVTPDRLPWRLGRYPYRSVYAQAGEKPSTTDALVGSLQTADLAALVVAEHNTALTDPYTDRY